jgi:hypothetical protein
MNTDPEIRNKNVENKIQKTEIYYIHCRMALLQKEIYKFKSIPTKISMTFFTEIKRKGILKFIWRAKGPNV